MGNDLAAWRLASPGRHLDGVSDELGAEMVSDRPAHNPSGPGVEHDRQVHLAGPGPVFGDVHDPQLVGAVGIEGAVDAIVGGVAVTGPGPAPAAAVVDAHRAADGHQAGHGGARAPFAEPEA